MRPERAWRWMKAPINEARKRANRIILEYDGYGGTSEKMVADAKLILAAIERLGDNSL